MLLLKNNLFSKFLAMAAVEEPEINGTAQPPPSPPCSRYFAAGVI